MRRVLTFVGGLAVAALVALAPLSLARAGGGEHGDPLAVADQLEKEGRAHLEQGHMAEGAKLLSKAWAIRAEVFAAAPTPPGTATPDRPQVRPEIEAALARVLELKARSNDAERAGKELKENGHGDEAAAKMEESGKLWREAEALQKKIDSLRAANRDRPEGEAAGVPPGKDAPPAAALLAALEQLRASVREQRAEAERQAAAGNETAAHQAKERAEQQARRIGELEGKLRALQGGGEPRPGGPREGGDAVAALAQQLEKLMRRMNEMQEKLNALQHRLEKAEKDD